MNSGKTPYELAPIELLDQLKSALITIGRKSAPTVTELVLSDYLFGATLARLSEARPPFVPGERVRPKQNFLTRPGGFTPIQGKPIRTIRRVFYLYSTWTVELEEDSYLTRDHVDADEFEPAT